MLELYHHGTSVCAAKPRIVLAEKGVEWTGHYVEILKGEQFAPAYLELNPKGVVPTLVHDGHVLRESTLICEYLDEVFPDPPMKPDDTRDRHAMRVWTKRIDEEVFPATAVVTFAISHRHLVLANPPDVLDEYINKLGPAEAPRRRQRLETGLDDADAAAALKVYDKFLADMDAALARRPWLAGDRFSLAEANAIPFVNRLDMLELSGMWKLSRPHLTAWWERIKDRPTFQDAMFKYVPAAVRKLMTEKGGEAWPKVKAILAGRKAA
jgi:glutathione S-transferase